MSDDLDGKIKSRIQQIFPDPLTATRVVDLVVHKRPKGWSRHSNPPYYKEIYAVAMKREVDKMIDAGSQICFRYEVWCNDETGIQPNTLYHRINQSIRYLIDYMDTPEHKYAKWYETVRIEKKQKVGIVIRFITGMGSEPMVEHKQSPEKMPQWRARLEFWLESEEVKPFLQEGLCLKPEEVADLQAEFAQLSNVMASITPNTIKVIKVV